jgi:hypothetical protein
VPRRIAQPAEGDVLRWPVRTPAAALFQGGGTVLGAFLPVVAMVVYLAVSLVFIIEPLRRVRIRGTARVRPG